MKRKLYVLALVICCLLVLTGCCFHKEWYAADCVNPKTCVECGETEGEALGHVWTDATCTAPKTCSSCRLTEGEALGHVWVDATTEAPKTCTTCAATEGERIITDPRFTTASTIDLYGKWTSTLSIPGEMFAAEGFEGTLDMQLDIELTNDGTMKMGYTLLNEEAFIEAVIDYSLEVVYAELEASGISRETTDQTMVDQYGMTTREFIEEAMGEANLTAAFEALNINGVYYVDGGKLYTGISWEEELGASDFTLEGDTLTLQDDLVGMSEELGDVLENGMVFTRVTE